MVVFFWQVFIQVCWLTPTNLVHFSSTNFCSFYGSPDHDMQPDHVTGSKIEQHLRFSFLPQKLQPLICCSLPRLLHFLMPNMHCIGILQTIYLLHKADWKAFRNPLSDPEAVMYLEPPICQASMIFLHDFTYWSGGNLPQTQMQFFCCLSEHDFTLLKNYRI
jgi:hypothetical protein